MTTVTIQVAGAPFDPGNIFRIPAIDAGPINNPYPTAFQTNMDGGFFTQTPTSPVIADGGTIPPAGTATYDPTKTYGPNDIVEIQVDIDN